MTDSTDEPRRQAHRGPLDFSELAHGMVQRIIGKADPEAEIDAEPTDAAPDSPQVAVDCKGGEARRAISGD